MPQAKGKFIVVEGGDGVGKTTIINRLKKDFPDFIYTREPGGTDFGEMIRSVLLDAKTKNVPPLALLFGFMSSRASHVQEKILPFLSEGRVVVSDRFDASTFAFQLHSQQNMDLENIFWSCRDAIFEKGDIFHPCYIYLSLDSNIARARREKRAEAQNHFDLQTSDYHNRVFQGYADFLQKIVVRNKSQQEVFVVDASQTEESVYREVVRIIQT